MEGFNLTKTSFLLLSIGILITNGSDLFANTDLGGQPCRTTPYDSYITTIRPVLKRLHKGTSNYGHVAKLLEKAHKIRQVSDPSFKTAPPGITSTLGEGDCKAKALWLANEMGDPNVRFVIGWANLNRNVRHAWIAWKHDNQWWILDPTWQKQPIPAASVGTGEYIACYSYDQKAAYYHPVTDHLQHTLAGFSPHHKELRGGTLAKTQPRQSAPEAVATRD